MYAYMVWQHIDITYILRVIIKEHSSAVERPSDTRETGGSNPPVPIKGSQSEPLRLIRSIGKDRGLLIPRYGFKSCMRHTIIKVCGAMDA